MHSLQLPDFCTYYTCANQQPIPNESADSSSDIASLSCPNPHPYNDAGSNDFTWPDAGSNDFHPAEPAAEPAAKPAAEQLAAEPAAQRE